MFISLSVLVFRGSVTGMPPLFFITFRKDVAAWSWISYVPPEEAQMILLRFFITWYGGATSTPKKYHLLEKIYIYYI